MRYIRVWTFFIIITCFSFGCSSSSSTSSDGGSTNSSSWTQEDGQRISDPYFWDVCVVQLDSEEYRMYGEKHDDPDPSYIASYTSTDGLSWTAEEGTRMENAGFPFVMELPDGT
jgi:hypothetical protein